MVSDDIFLCKQCGLPIRKREEATPHSERFTCRDCPVCKDAEQDEIDRLKERLLKLLCETVRNLYRYRRGAYPSGRFMAAIREKLMAELNPAEEKVKAIRDAIKNDRTCSSICWSRLPQARECWRDFSTSRADIRATNER